MLLGLLGVPISRMPPRRSRSGNLTVGLVGCIVYYNLLVVVMHAVEDGRLPVWPGLLLVPLIGGAVLAALMALSRR